MTDVPTPDPTPTAAPIAGIRRGRAMALVAIAFVCGSLFSGAGAVWAEHQFSDVPNNSPFHDEIDWMADNGITEGYDDDTFKPTNPVSRQAFSAFLQRYNDRIVVKQVDTNPGSAQLWSFTATCDPGMRAVGGGGSSMSNMMMTGSYPVVGGTTWRVDFRADSPIDPTVARAYALCVPA